MKISQKGLYALQALMMLARHYNQGAIRIRDIAYEEELPEKRPHRGERAWGEGRVCIAAAAFRDSSQRNHPTH